MKKKVVIAVALLLVSSLLLGACAAGVTQEDYDSVAAERDAAQAQVTSSQAARDAAQAEVASLEAAADEAGDMIAVLQAMGRYHDEAVALADGYVSTVECVEEPGLGGMGIHYVNFALFEAPPDLLTPQILLYNPTDDGGVKLIGVEYFAPALTSTAEGPAPWFDPEAEPADGWFSSAPSLLGQTFDGPMAGHGPEDPWHYDLHVYLWPENPSGMFAEFNPDVSCPG